MTLDEAIKHCEDVAEDRAGCCEDCAEEHRQLAEWLTDYRDMKIKQIAKSKNYIFRYNNVRWWRQRLRRCKGDLDVNFIIQVDGKEFEGAYTWCLGTKDRELYIMLSDKPHF